MKELKGRDLFVFALKRNIYDNVLINQYSKDIYDDCGRNIGTITYTESSEQSSMTDSYFRVDMRLKQKYITEEYSLTSMYINSLTEDMCNKVIRDFENHLKNIHSNYLKMFDSLKYSAICNNQYTSSISVVNDSDSLVSSTVDELKKDIEMLYEEIAQMKSNSFEVETKTIKKKNKKWKRV